jgi:Tol biopolymer transport system component/predicted Ser/Thr protein kinase
VSSERFQQVEELYHSARELEPDKRGGFLAEACRGDEELRREVELLLAQDGVAGPMEQPALEVAAKLLSDSTATHLAAGAQLGPYRIEGLLGAGGMGEVYRAVDTRLDRKVAIKVCAEQFSGRFEREARAISALNHPHICTLYDVGPNYLVMELVEGETLSARLRKGPLPIDQALRYGAEIADALAAAHAKGIIHRDLKPANVMVTKSGVKVLDFGLAKTQRDETLTGRAIMGTPAYMAPEQREGRECDARTDIYALGLVLREMATGSRVPAHLEHVVERCIANDPDDRWQAASDVRKELEWTSAGQAILSPATPSPATRSPAVRGWLAGGVLALALGLLSFLYFRPAPPPEHVLRSTISLPENTTVLHSFAISPDGRYLAMSAQVNGKRQLWLRTLDALQAQPVPGTDDAIFPFWSPDSRNVGFFTQGKLKKIAASGGPVQSLADAPDGRGGSWNRDNVILFGSNAGSAPIQRVSAEGGVPADATRQKGFSRFPVFLPDGRHFLYTVAGVSADQNGVYLSSLDGKENRRVLADVSSVVFAAGRLLFVREDILMAQTFDAASGQARGEVFPVAEHVLKRAVTYAWVSASETGVLLYLGDGGGALRNQFQLAWYERGGTLLGAVGAPGSVFDPAISPDEKSVVFRRANATGAVLWLRDLARGAEQRFTTDPSGTNGPHWSPQGDRIAFESARSGGIFNLYQKAATGTGNDELLLANGSNKWLSQWSRDGRFIVYTEADPKTKLDVWVLHMGAGAERKPAPFLRSEFNERLGQLSPDSHWMAYTSDESGRREVYVRPFPAAEGQWKISLAGGDQPRWRGDGKELFFVGADRMMMAVAVRGGSPPGPGTKPSFEAGAPQPLFEANLAQSPANNVLEYDVTADGKRFLLATVVAGATSEPPLTVVSNWTAGLKK